MNRCILATLFSALALVGCTNEKATRAPQPTAQVKPAFVPPTAEQAYRLQDDCTRRGVAILKANVIGSALAQEQVSRYNPTTNRCYVRLEVHAGNLEECSKYDNSTYLKDGQTQELLAYYRQRPDGGTAYLGFGCGDAPCVSEKIAACMSGKVCE